MESNLEYKQKYLEYKLKYLDKKYNQTGGMELKFTSDGTQVNKVLPGVAARAAAAAAEPEPAERAAAAAEPAERALTRRVKPNRPPPTPKITTAEAAAEAVVEAAAEAATRRVKPTRPPPTPVTREERRVVQGEPVSVVTAHATPFPTEQLLPYTSIGENYLYYFNESKFNNISDLVRLFPRLNRFNYAICITSGKIVIVNMRNFKQLILKWNMLQGVFEHSTSNHNEFVKIIKNKQPIIDRNKYKNENYPVIVFTMENPEVDFGGIEGLYPLVENFFE